MTFESVAAQAPFFKASAMVAKAQDDAPLRRTIRSHWVRPNPDGDLEGKISTLERNAAIPIAQLEVKLVQQGVKKYQATTNAAGRFVIEDVKDGTYTLIASGKNGFMAYGIEVVPNLVVPDEPGGPDDVNDEFGQNHRKSINAYYVSTLGLPSGAVIQDELQIDAAAVPPRFNTLQRITNTYISSEGAASPIDVKAIGKSGEVAGGFQHGLSADGSFKGRLQPIATRDGQESTLADMNIFLIQDDLEKARVTVEENGDFEVTDVEPGVYAIIAAGKDGFAAISLELVAGENADADARLPTNQPSVMHVSARIRQVVPLIGIAIVNDPADMQFIQRDVVRVAALNQLPVVAVFQPQGIGFEGGLAAPGGGFGAGGLAGGSSAGGAPANGGFSSGGLNAGGLTPSGGVAAAGGLAAAASSGSGFGRLVALAGLGGGVVAISNDESSNPPPASPSTTQ